jgi:ribosomal protein L11
MQSLERSFKGIQLDDPELTNAVHKLAKLAGKVKANLACMDEEDLRSGKLEATLQTLLDSCNGMGVRMSKVFFPSREEVIA